MLQDAVATGTGFMVDGKRVDPKDVLVTAASKVSSPELASLAAKYMDLTYVQVETMSAGRLKQLVDDVRSLAASVLAQAEGAPRK